MVQRLKSISGICPKLITAGSDLSVALGVKVGAGVNVIVGGTTGRRGTKRA
jgi:hypothetical protein